MVVASALTPFAPDVTFHYRDVIGRLHPPPGPSGPAYYPLRPPLAQTASSSSSSYLPSIVVITCFHQISSHRSASNTYPYRTDPGPEHHHTLDKRACITSQSYIRSLRGCRESNAALVFGQPPFPSRLRIDPSISTFRSVVLVSSLL